MNKKLLKYQQVFIGALVLMALSAGGGALADPDYAPYVLTGWDDSVVPSDIANQAIDSATFPVGLFGDETSYFAWGVANWGDAVGTGYVGHLRLDEETLYTLENPPNNGTAWGGWNIARHVAGGRHTLWQVNDPDGLVPENDETNNAYAKQFVWHPALFDLNAVAQREHPPFKNEGRTHIPSGDPSYQNIDAVQTPYSTSGWWYVAAVSPIESGPDYDVRSYSTLPTFQGGLDNDYEASSTAGSSNIDGILINRNNVSTVNRSMGVLNFNGSEVPYLFDHRHSGTVIEPGYVGDGVLAENQIFQIEELFIPDGSVGSVTLVLDLGQPDQAVRLAVYGNDFTEASIHSALGTVQTDESGRATLVLDFTESDYYGIGIFRNAYQGTAPLNYSLTVRSTTADIVSVALPGSHAPLVPYITLDGGIGDPQSAPAMLEGDIQSTNLYHQYANLSPVDSDQFQVAFQVDGVQVGELDQPYGSGLPGDPGVIRAFGYGGFNVPGGRHTLTGLNDSQNTVDEIFEDNNAYAEQWIWNPTQLAEDASLVRGAPPETSGGWEHIPADGIRHDNVDGVRSQTFTINGGIGYWGGVAILPQDGADLDLFLFDPSMGAQDGFADPLESSTAGGSNCEYILLDFDGPLDPGQAFDVGTSRFDGEASYGVQSTRSAEIGIYHQNQPGSFGIFELDSDEVIEVLEINIADGSEGQPVLIRAENLNGNVDLLLAVHQRDESEFQNRYDSLASMNQEGPGQGEELIVTFPEAGYYAVVLAKRNHEDFGLAGQFEVSFLNPGLTDTPDEMVSLPKASGIASVYPNPFNPQTTVRFNMHKSGPVAVRVYDIKGRLVKTLAEGNLEAGQHEMNWQGKDDSGHGVPSGVYFVRAVHPSGVDNHRIALVK